MRNQEQALQQELDAAMVAASSEWCDVALRRLTDLFLCDARAYGPDHVAVYDGVMLRLVVPASRQSLAELSRRLAPVDNAPPNTVDHLSRHADIAVAGPLLERSSVLSAARVAEIAETASAAHLLAIGRRAHIEKASSDILIERGGPEVLACVAGNRGAAISEAGFSRLISKAATDKRLGTTIAERTDVPEELRSFLALMLN